LHDYCVIVEIVVVPREASSFSRHRGLWTLPGAVGTFARSPRLRESDSLPTPSPSVPPTPGLLLLAPPRRPRGESS
jgi:hypothetical protein